MNFGENFELFHVFVVLIAGFSLDLSLELDARAT